MQSITLGFYRLIRAVEASVVEKRGKAKETYLKKPEKRFRIRHLAYHYD